MKLDRGFYLSMLAHALEERPNECVGLLAGPQDGALTRIFRLTNVAAEPRQTYQVGAKEQLRIEKQIEAAGLVPLAIYHSHPTAGAVPSSFDYMTAWNDVVTIIIGLAQLPETVSLRAFRLHQKPAGMWDELIVEVV